MSLITPLLLPIVVPQAFWVAARAARLPEADGPREGRLGHGAPLRVLIVGDSSAAGVGVDHQSEALSGQLTGLLARRFAVQWRLIARSGATSGSLLALLDESEAASFDMAVVALGVNDAKNGHATRTWERGYGAVLDLLEEKFGVTRIYACGFPPVRVLPRLPPPLKSVLADRCDAFDAVMRRIVAERPVARYVPLTLTGDSRLMASDGFHPGPKLYAEWAGILEPRVIEDFPAGVVLDRIRPD